MKVKVGDIVLVWHDNQKRFNQPLEKVVEAYPSENGTVGVAKVKTENSFLIHTLQKLYPLKISSSNDSDLIRMCNIKTVLPTKDSVKKDFDQPKRTRISRKDDLFVNFIQKPKVSSKSRLVKSPHKLDL